MGFTQDGVTLTVRVAFASTPLASSPSWTDITSYVQRFRIYRGRSRELDTFGAGRVSELVLKNNDRRFDPDHATGPYYGNLLPMKRINIRVTYNSVTYDLFTGFVDGWPQSFVQRGTSFVNLNATDGFKLLEGIDLPGSLYEFVTGQDTPDHWWHLHDEAGATAALDGGYSSADLPLLPLGSGPTFGATGLLSYDGGGTAATFNTSASLESASLIEATGTQTGSVELWFKSAGTNATATDWGLFNSSSDAGSTLQLYISGSAYAGGAGILVATEGIGAAVDSGATRVDDGAVHHVVFTRIANGGNVTQTLYLDGASIDTGLVSAAARGGGKVRVGDLLGAHPFVAGQIAEVAYWANTTLTAAQVAAHYNAGITALPETIGTRVGRVLDYAGWPTADRAIDTGNTTLAAYDLDAQTALAYLQSLARAEFGAFYILGNGNANFRQRHALITETNYKTAQGTFDASGNLQYHDLEGPVQDDADLTNEARMTRQGGVEQFASDATSKTNYGRRTFSESGLLLQNDSEAASRSQWVIARRKNPVSTFRRLVVKPRRSPSTLYPKVFGLDLEYMISVAAPAITGSATTKNVRIQSIEHVVDVSAQDWTTTWELSNATQDTAYLILDDATYGKLDTGALAY